MKKPRRRSTTQGAEKTRDGERGRERKTKEYRKTFTGRYEKAKMTKIKENRLNDSETENDKHSERRKYQKRIEKKIKELKPKEKRTAGRDEGEE